MKSADRKTRAKMKLAYKQTKWPMGIFQIKNMVNGRVFIGSTKNLDVVHNRHKFQLNQGGHPNKGLQQDWNRYGPESFTFSTLEELEPGDDLSYNYTEDLQLLEAIWHEKLQPYGEKGYHKPPGLK